MVNEEMSINEGFVAGVGFEQSSGFTIGPRTKGLMKHPELLEAFNKDRKDIIFDGQSEKQSLTIFPANENAMTIVCASYLSEGTTDRRSHSFCHGIIVDNKMFTDEVLPVLDLDSFSGQFLNGPAEDLELEDEDVLRFKPIQNENNKENCDVHGNDTEKEYIFAFALKTIARGGNYIVKIGDANRRAFLKVLYKMLPPPYRYRLESCSCGEYGRMMNVLIAADKPYQTMDRYKILTLNQILRDDITVWKQKYPKLYSIVADDLERIRFYNFLEGEESFQASALSSSISQIQEVLETKAKEYLNGHIPENDICLTTEEAPTIEERVLERHISQNTQLICNDDIFLYDYDEMIKRMSEEAVFNEAKSYLPDQHFVDLIDNYLKCGDFMAYVELRNNLFKPGVGDVLRSIQRRRLKDFLAKRDTAIAIKRCGGMGEIYFLKLVMLAFQMSPEEYITYQEYVQEDEIFFGPYRYKEIERFLRERTCHGKKLLGTLGRLSNPFG